jgi:hypothetical protein
MNKKKIDNIPKAFTNFESKDGESSDFGLLWEGVIRPTKVESFEQNGKPTHLVVNNQPPIINNILIIKK